MKKNNNNTHIKIKEKNNTTYFKGQIRFKSSLGRSHIRPVDKVQNVLKHASARKIVSDEPLTMTISQNHVAKSKWIIFW